MGRRTLVVAQIALLATSLVVVVTTSRASDWTPVGLVVLLAGIAVASDAMAIETKVSIGPNRAATSVRKALQ